MSLTQLMCGNTMKLTKVTFATAIARVTNVGVNRFATGAYLNRLQQSYHER